MKTRFNVLIVMAAFLSAFLACTDDEAINRQCAENIVNCAKFCLSDANLCQSEVETFPELAKAIDSIRAVSKLPVRN